MTQLNIPNTHIPYSPDRTYLVQRATKKHKYKTVESFIGTYEEAFKFYSYLPIAANQKKRLVVEMGPRITQSHVISSEHGN